MGFLNGKKILITGVLSNHSIAYGIAQVCHREGAELAFSYAGDHARDRIGKFAEEFGSDFILPLDVTKNEHIEGAVKTIQEKWGGLDGFVHSIGYAPREAITGDFLEGFSREAFLTAMDISAGSYPLLAKAFLPLMEGRPGFHPRADLSRQRARDPELQHDGSREGRSRSVYPLPVRQPRPPRHPCERDFLRPGEDPGCVRHQGFRQNAS